MKKFTVALVWFTIGYVFDSCLSLIFTLFIKKRKYRKDI